jgi:hypothetical protein
MTTPSLGRILRQMSELQSFVLDYLEEQGGIAEPAGSAIFDVLLPEATADALGSASLQTWAFADPGVPDDEVLWLTLNTPVIERMIEAARANPTATQYLIGDVRLNKQGLADLAREAWLLPNARIIEPHGSMTVRVLNSYLLFNFKVALLSDDKQEQMVSVLLDAQGGYALSSAETEQILLAAQPKTPDTIQPTMREGIVRWHVGKNENPLPVRDINTLNVLLERAQIAVIDLLAEPIKRLQKRSARFLALDEARLNAYYDEVEQDLRLRAARAVGERVANLNEKLALTASERQNKLEDAVTRYQVRADLALINVMLIQQPKLALPLQLQNRKTQRGIVAVYDPLLHRIEPLLCEVCQRTGRRLQLCQNGHLAHTDCLAPQCIDCQRVYCRLCADEIGQCAVCHEPLCHTSAIKCNECDRVTCRAHRNMCHADQGAPVDLSQAQPEPEVSEPTEPRPPETKPKPRPQAKPHPRRSAEKPLAWPRGVPRPQRIEVVISDDRITAFLLASREREIASRRWLLSAERAIERSCICEKGGECAANGYVLRPAMGRGLLEQMRAEIDAFRKEYRIPRNRVKYNEDEGPYNPPTPMRRFELPESWLDPDLLAQAREAFDYFARFDEWPT